MNLHIAMVGLWEEEILRGIFYRGGRITKFVFVVTKIGSHSLIFLFIFFLLTSLHGKSEKPLKVPNSGGRQLKRCYGALEVCKWTFDVMDWVHTTYRTRVSLTRVCLMSHYWSVSHNTARLI